MKFPFLKQSEENNKTKSELCQQGKVEGQGEMRNGIDKGKAIDRPQKVPQKNIIIKLHKYCWPKYISSI